MCSDVNDALQDLSDLATYISGLYAGEDQPVNARGLCESFCALLLLLCGFMQLLTQQAVSARMLKLLNV